MCRHRGLIHACFPSGVRLVALPRRSRLPVPWPCELDSVCSRVRWKKIITFFTKPGRENKLASNRTHANLFRGWRIYYGNEIESPQNVVRAYVHVYFLLSINLRRIRGHCRAGFHEKLGRQSQVHKIGILKIIGKPIIQCMERNVNVTWDLRLAFANKCRTITNQFCLHRSKHFWPKHAVRYFHRFCFRLTCRKFEVICRAGLREKLWGVRWPISLQQKIKIKRLYPMYGM